MKTKYISASLASVLLTFSAMAVASSHSTPGSSAVTCTPYAGIAIAWDQMKGKRSESLVNFRGNRLVFSEERSLSSDRINGGVFLGAYFESENWPIFMSPEFQIGQGALISSKRDNTVPDSDLLLPDDQPLQRSLDAKLSRTVSMSLVLRAGRTLMQSFRLYALGGIGVSRFKYTYAYGGVNAMMQGYKNITHSRWKCAPIIGLGIEQEVGRVRVGLEYRTAFYKRLKISHTVETRNEHYKETVLAGLKPRVSSLMLKLAYTF